MLRPLSPLGTALLSLSLLTASGPALADAPEPEASPPPAETSSLPTLPPSTPSPEPLPSASVGLPPPPPPESLPKTPSEETDAAPDSDEESTDAEPSSPQKNKKAKKKKGKAVLFDLGAGTYLPLMMGISATVQIPYRIVLQAELGFMPRAYTNMINSILVGVSAYDETTASLIDAALGNSMVVRLSAGFKPFRKAGLEIFGGYTLAALGGGLSGVQAIEIVTGRDLPDEAGQEIPMHTVLHSLHLGVGWRFLIKKHFVFRPSIWYMQAIASSSGIDIQARPRVVQQAVDQANTELNQYLNGIYTDYVKVPLIGLWGAYRF